MTNGETETAKAEMTTKATGSKDGGASFDVAALRVALANAGGVPKVSRATLAGLVGSHVNSVALWESGTKIGDRFLAKLRELDARIAKGEKIKLPAEKKRGRPRKAESTPTTAKKLTAKRLDRPKKTKSAAPKRVSSAKLDNATSFDVKALRTKLGTSREAFAKLLGVSAGSVQNWESGRPIREKNLAGLRVLAKKSASGEVQLPERKMLGRPKKATATRTRATSVAGTVPLLYANVVTVTKGQREALLRFALSLPGERARAVADVVVPVGTLDELAT